jgi:arylsulfatase A-like enzyme
MRVSLAAAVLFAAGCGRAPESPAPLPDAPVPFAYRDHNLVFVSFDALQASRVGPKLTPALHRFSEGAFRFTEARSVASWTVPASMSWFTGVYPSEHGMTNKFAVYTAKEKRVARLSERAPGLATLADVLRLNGYATAGFTGNAGVGPAFGFDQGFDTYAAPRETFAGFEESAPRALEWLRAHKHRKFFLFLHGYDVHGQHAPNGGLDLRFAPKGYDRRFTGSPQEQELLREEGLERGRVTLRPEDVALWRGVYDEKVQRADAKFGAFLEEFEKLGIAERTLFVIVSDHGTELHEHGRFDHGFTLYDELIRVPLVFKLPRAPGRAIADRVSTIDLFPTLLDLLAVKPPDVVAKRVRGESLVPALKGTSAARSAFAETDYRAYTYKRCVVSPDGFKLIYTLESRSRELYDLTTDPGETRDLSKADPARANELERELFAHFARLGHDLTARKWEVGLNPVYSSQGK